MSKNNSYEEFLAEAIERGKADIDAGRVISFEDHKAKMKQIMESKRLELEANKSKESEIFAYA